MQIIGKSKGDLSEVITSIASIKRGSLNGFSDSDTAAAKSYFEMEEVRIYPARLTFAGAYDGKTFLEKFSIINVGRVPAFVRVMLPTSNAFKMKPLPKGRILSTGLSITRYIRYTYSSAIALPQVYISIYINEKPILYELEVFLSEPLVKMYPKILHFGEIDIGTASEQLSINLHNEGQKISHFVVDLGRNDLELIVDPMKGSIQPSETIEINVEILGSREGNFLKEFWIKTDPPQRIWITGTFITPKLKVEHPLSNFDLIVIDFPKTYYNADSIRTLIIKNSSSKNSMYCAMADYKEDEQKLSEARKHDVNLKFFIFNPKEGRLTKNHKAAIIIRFAPRKLRTFTQKYCISMIKIRKINYRDGVLKGKDIEVKTFLSNVEVDQYQMGSVYSLDEEFSEFEFFNSYLRICLYGEIEEANVKLTPHAIDRDSVIEGDLYNFTFNIKNCSKYLPITYKYEKIACFEMDPPELNLKPNASVDVLLILKPTTIGQIDTKIRLHLTYKANGIVYNVGVAYFNVRYKCHNHPYRTQILLKPKFNLGITPAVTNEVGYLVDRVKFGDRVEAPIKACVTRGKLKRVSKYKHSLVAFPNDRQQSLRPWRSETPCLTIFTHHPRVQTIVDKYMLTPSELVLKTRNDQKYLNYIRRNRNKVISNELAKQDTHYPTDIRKVLMTNEPMKDCPEFLQDSIINPEFIALTPEQLLGIEITPHYIQLGKIAPYISCSDFFTIENKNDFTIIIAIVALNNSVVVKGKRRIKIGSHAKERLYFDCYSHGLGKYYVPVFIIVNDCHIFDATVFAEVVPSTVKARNREVVIHASDNVGYLELFNPVNCAIDFSWYLQDSNYTIMPSNGTIDSRRSLYCKIIFTPKVDAVFKTDMLLFSQSGAKQVVTLIHQNKKASLSFSTNTVEFKNIPFNKEICEYLVVKNNSTTTIVIYTKQQHPMNGITISPKEAILPGKSVLFFQVHAKFKTIGKFKCHCTFVAQDEYKHQIEILGNINCPTFTVSPNFIQITKIITGACQRKVFRITNTNTAKLSFKFSMDLYTDYRVIDMNKNPVDSIHLNPQEYKDLYLEFIPLEPTAYTFYVPMVLNDVIGPPLLNNPKSFNYTTYFDRPLVRNQFEEAVMPGLRVTCAAGAAWFKFSSFFLNFTNDIRKNDFHIANVTSVKREFKLIIEALETCFSVSIKCFCGAQKMKPRSINIILEPDEEIVFEFKFKPECTGIFSSEVPIYVTDYFENCPFNYIRLHAVGRQPTINSKKKTVRLPTIPLKSLCTTKVMLDLDSHNSDCKLTTTSGDIFLKTELKQPKHDDKSKQELRVTFIPKQVCNVTSQVTISCTCGATYDIVVIASANNCSLLSYRHRMKWKTDVKYEFTSAIDEFDFNINNPLYVEKLNRLQNILERYVYSQGFFSTYFYKIPETISRYPFEAYKQDKKKTIKEKKRHLPVVVLLKNLTEISTLDYIYDGTTNPNIADSEGTVYDYKVYKNILLYIEEYGMFSKNIKPEFLLTYNRYMIFKENLIDSENIVDDEIVPEEEFNFYNKENWVDLLLRIYKLLVYDRLLASDSPKTGKIVADDYFRASFMEYYMQNRELIQPGIEVGEAKLLLWLEFHFKTKKDKLWPDTAVPLRNIRDLTTDVRDSLPLIALMATYCPYLEDSFKEIYFEPFTDPGQLLHNACLLSEAWNKLELSFTIPTNNIVEPNNTEMIILLSYLFNVLPYFYPTECLTITSDLGETTSVHVSLKNPGHVTVSYKAILFLNENESFHLSNDTVVLNPKQEQDIRVYYTAKQIIREDAVLVLSGETGAQKYSKSAAINIVGIPNILHFTEEFNIGVNMYEYTTKTIQVNSPYCKVYTANTYFYLYDAINPPMTMKDFVSVNEVPTLPKQFRIEGNCEFDKDGKHKLNINLCFITVGTYTYYIYFVNKDVGVFSIKLEIESKLPEYAFEDVKIRIPSNFDTLSPCKCKPGNRNTLCTRMIKADIPIRNTHLLSGLRKMIKIHAEADEMEFWYTHLVFPKGFHIFRQYIENTFEHVLIPFKKVLNPDVVYYPRTVSENYSTEKSVRVTDTTDEGTFQLLLHWNASSFPTTEFLFLKADNGQEVRKYVLTFWTREPRRLV